MILPGFLAGVPKIVLVLVVPAIAFAVTVGISLGTGNTNDEKQVAIPTVAVAVTNRQPLPTAAPQVAAPAPAATAIPDRSDCSAIRGTDYRSSEEREWFVKNCSGGSTNTASAGTTTSTNTARATTAATAGGGASAAPAPAAQPARAAVAGAQVPSGQRLVIPTAGINANIDITKMASFDMPDPKSYFNALAYDMTDLGGGLGGNGTPASGNLVLSGHVDCASCINGGSGTAVFWSARNLKPGDTAQVYDAAGKVTSYVVTRSQAVGAGTNWDAILAAGAADMTIITCTGTFNSATREYDQRHYVSFKKA